MSVEENKNTLRRNFEEIWNKKNFSLIPELISPDYVGINAYGVFKGREGYKQMAKNQTTNMPDLRYEVNEVIGEGDTLMAKLTVTGTYTGQFGSLDISGKKIKGTMVLVNRYKDGKCIESTAYSNPLELFKQLGVMIPPEWGMG
jgi:predicted ester cyclase